MYSKASGHLDSMAALVIDSVTQSLNTEAENLTLQQAHTLVRAAIKVSKAAYLLRESIEHMNNS